MSDLQLEGGRDEACLQDAEWKSQQVALSCSVRMETHPHFY